MKKLVIIFVLGILTCSFGAFAQIKVASTGYVGINNTSPAYRLDVSGNLRIDDPSGGNLLFQYGQLYSTSGYSMLGTSGSYWNELYAYDAYFYYSTTYYSDLKLKSDIRDIENTGSKLMLLKPVKYKMLPKFKGDLKADSIMAEKAKIDQMGFIAQDMQKIFPELVTQDKAGALGIKYIELIPILVKAYQEQQAELESLKARVAKLEGK
ncbi:MAG: tail fiber domain-containing protein [Bacteroidota bacterium]|nr:tail fiber domain-containing protein [Bacteroidota bacterium]